MNAGSNVRVTMPCYVIRQLVFSQNNTFDRGAQIIVRRARKQWIRNAALTGVKHDTVARIFHESAVDRDGETIAHLEPCIRFVDILLADFCNSTLES